MTGMSDSSGMAMALIWTPWTRVEESPKAVLYAKVAMAGARMLMAMPVTTWSTQRVTVQ